MFTFIKIAYRGAIHGRAVERLWHQAHPRAQQPEQDGPQRTNPWELELKRLNNQVPRGDRRQYFQSQLPKPDPASRSPTAKQATLQELRSWWGQSCTTTKDQQHLDSQHFAPPPSQGRNHWFQ